MNQATYVSRDAAVAALQSAAAAVESLFVVQETHSGIIHASLTGLTEAGLARRILPTLNGTALGRILRAHARECISEHR